MSNEDKAAVEGKQKTKAEVLAKHSGHYSDLLEDAFLNDKCITPKEAFNSMQEWGEEIANELKKWKDYPPPVQGISKEGCPCLYLDEPCMPRCTCIIGGSSAGCLYCCTYGSLEQRKEAAKRIAKKLSSSPSNRPQ